MVGRHLSSCFPLSTRGLLCLGQEVGTSTQKGRRLVMWDLCLLLCFCSTTAGAVGCGSSFPVAAIVGF